MSVPLIFIVDDELPVLELLSMVFKPDGYSLRPFGNSSEALRELTLGGTLPDLLITDYQMPDLCGLELIQECKMIHPRLKTLLYSANATPDVIAAYGIKPDVFLPKPASVQAIRGAVRLLLEA